MTGHVENDTVTLVLPERHYSAAVLAFWKTHSGANYYRVFDSMAIEGVWERIVDYHRHHVIADSHVTVESDDV